MAPPAIDLDVVLGELGSYGLFQLEMLIYLALPLLIKAMYNTQYVFAAGVTDYRCRVPQCESTPEQFEPGPWAEFALPELLKRDCYRYVATGTKCEAASFTKELERCWSWVYENHNTIVYDLELACQEVKRTMVGTVHSFAYFTALPVIAFLSDAWGRGRVLIAAAILPAFFGVWRAFVNSYYVYIVVEYMESFVGCATFGAAFILGIESVTIDNRVIAGNLVGGLYSFGQSFLGVFGYFFRYWRTFTLVIYIPSFAFFSYIYFYKESLRWLVTTGRNKEAAKIILRAAKLNKKTLSRKTMASLQAPINEEKPKEKEVKATAAGQKKPSIWRKVIKSKTILYRVVVCSYVWTTMQLVAYGLSINSVSLAGNRYLNFSISSLIEIPGKVLSAVVLDRFGRKRSMCAAEFGCGIALILTGFIKYDLIVISLTMFGKLLISMISCSTYIYTIELFPTEARHSLLGVCSMMGRVGSMLAPQTPLLDVHDAETIETVELSVVKAQHIRRIASSMLRIELPGHDGLSIEHLKTMQINKNLPNLIFGVLSAIGGVLLLLLPETLGMKLPDTVEEAENLKTMPKADVRGDTDKK